MHMTHCRYTNKFATSTLPLAASLYPLSYGPTVRRKLSACEATDYLLQHLATERAQLQSAITGQCVPHYYLTEIATGYHILLAHQTPIWYKHIGFVYMAGQQLRDNLNLQAMAYVQQQNS